MTEETVQTVTDEEELIVFRRFPKEKQDQVRALVNYATLMGLSGKDLVSIGGKLERLKVSQEKRAREVVLEELVKRCELIGRDRKDYRAMHDPNRFDYTDSTGRKWRIENIDWASARVTSDTGTTKRVRIIERYTISGRGRYDMKQFLLNVHYGNIQLNF